MTRQYLLPIENQWLRPTGGRFTPVENPADGSTLAEVASGSAADVDAVTAAAKAALHHSDWAHNPRRRAVALRDLARKMTDHLDELATVLTQENGKSLFESRAEIRGAIDSLEFYGGLCRTLYGRAAEFIPGVYGVVLREPVGVVGVIVPWNWPISLLMRSVAPALAAGNTVVVKPTSFTPLCTLEILRLAMEVEALPPGVLGGITGSGSVVGNALVGHPDVDMIAFTGDTDTGKQVMKLAADSVKKVSLELGGKSPNIVFADANLDKAVPGAVSAAFTTAGQICTAGSRLLVQESIHDEFVSRIKAAVEAIKVGDGMAPGTRMGPVVSQGQLDRTLDFVNTGLREARLVTGGERLDGEGRERGYFVAPTIFTAVPPNSSLAQEEIFGPILSVIPFRDEAEALAIANNTIYGLAAGVWTANVDRAIRIGRSIQAGTVWINTYHQFYNEAEVGGYKQSGIGRHQGLEVLNEFSELKHLNFDTRADWISSR